MCQILLASHMFTAGVDNMDGLGRPGLRLESLRFAGGFSHCFVLTSFDPEGFHWTACFHWQETLECAKKATLTQTTRLEFGCKGLQSSMWEVNHAACSPFGELERENGQAAIKFTKLTG